MRESLADYGLRTGRKELLTQWDREKNLPLTPDQVSYGSKKSVWWRCGRGHAWQAQIKSRTEGCGCPVCAGRIIVPGENDLASRFPALAAQWHPEKNGELTPREVAPGSHKKVWWQCGQGHVWRAVVYSRTGRRRTGCPVCAGAEGRSRSAGG